MSFQACDQCSSIKQKCDGNAPCSRCARLDLQCARLRGRGKQRREKGDLPIDSDAEPKRYKAAIVRRDKTGCLQCKKRKKKCDELKPKCSDCRRLNLPCIPSTRPTASKSKNVAPEAPSPDSTPSLDSSLSQIVVHSGPVALSPDSDSMLLDDQFSIPQQSLYQWLEMGDLPMISDSPENFDDFEKVNFDNNDLSFLTLGAMPENMMFQMNSPGSPLNWSSPMKSVSIPYALVIPAISQLKNRQDQHLLQHYASVVSKSLCIASTDEDNPFLKLMMPLASNSSAVMGALLALSAVHLKYNGGYPETVNRGISHQTKAISSLNDLITTGASTAYFKEQALAAILLLCIIDIREGNSSRWACHIAAAKTLIVSTTETPLSPDSSSLWPFLLDIFEYVDSIITISKCKPPLIDHANLQESNALMVPATKYNAIFGVARPIFRLIGQISTLSNRRKYRITEEYDQRFRAQAAIVDAELRSWTPPEHVSMQINASSSIFEGDLCDATNAAHALRWASILRLHQIVEGYSLPHPVPTECLRHILEHLRLIRVGSPVESQLLFPLIIAGSVAIAKEDRMEIRSRWLIIERTIGFGNVAVAGKMQEKFWQKLDAEIEGTGEDREHGKISVNWAKLRWFEFPELVLF